MVVNDAAFFLSHRLAVAEGARAAGYSVHIATMPGEAVAGIVAYGFPHHSLPLSRNGKSPLAELRSIYALWRLFWRLRPDIVHLVTIKPVLYGGIAARLAPVQSVVAAVSGLGFVFMAAGRRAASIRSLVRLLYRCALGQRNVKVIFQNPDDRQALLRLGAVRPERTVLLRGSGVDLSLYQALPEREGLPVITLASRLLRDKGIFEFIGAARLLRQRGVQARLQLAGALDPGNPTSVDDAQLQHWRSEGVVDVLGQREDIPALLAASHLVVLPSYREGLPKVLVEAAACGRAVVTTDVPGCRDAIEPGVTGLLVPVRDCVALADAIQRLVEDVDLRQRMGRAGRELAERAFSIDKIVDQHMAIYRQLEHVR